MIKNSALAVPDHLAENDGRNPGYAFNHMSIQCITVKRSKPAVLLPTSLFGTAVVGNHKPIQLSHVSFVTVS